MTHWEFQTTCIKHCISPSIVWDNENFRELVDNDNLTTETLNELLNNQFRSTIITRTMQEIKKQEGIIRKAENLIDKLENQLHELKNQS